jgi:hypothetical protein
MCVHFTFVIMQARWRSAPGSRIWWRLLLLDRGHCQQQQTRSLSRVVGIVWWICASSVFLWSLQQHGDIIEECIFSHGCLT